MNEIIDAAIAVKGTVRLRYEGNERHIPPLVRGVRTNGKPALLCMKLDQNKQGEMEYSIRLYHLESVTDVRPDEYVEQARIRGIDYHVQRQFITVDARVQP